jgi:quercetin dioxygenase-like cupin family protein
MRKMVLAAMVLGAAGVLTAAAFSQPAKPPPNDVKRYLSTPLEGDASREVRMQSNTMPPGGANNFHRHPGDQWALIQEGEITLTEKGKAPRVLKAGDAVHILRGVVHRQQNLTDKPARMVEIVIVDKDKPQTEQVPE